MGLGVSTRLAADDARGEQGAQALYEGVGRLGYTPNRLEYREFSLEQSDSALIILSPPQARADMVKWLESIASSPG